MAFNEYKRINPVTNRRDRINTLLGIDLFYSTLASSNFRNNGSLKRIGKKLVLFSRDSMYKSSDSCTELNHR